MKTDTMLNTKDVRQTEKKTSIGFRLAVCNLFMDDIELPYFKAIRIAR